MIDAKQASSLIDAVTRPAGTAAIRSQCVNNEKQIGLAIHNYICATRLISAGLYPRQGGQAALELAGPDLAVPRAGALYKEFHLDEAWDSPHNKALIARMPATYRCPAESDDLARQGKTRYLTPRGKATIFPGAETVKLRDITDGTSNTIMVVEADDAHAVIWTKPDDWDVGPERNTAGVAIIFTPLRQGSNFGLADGSVKFLHDTISPQLLAPC